jgi:hypothetical protein
MSLTINGQSALLAVPAADSANNVTIADVIGNKLDTHAGNSIKSYVDELYDQFQLERHVYPSLGVGATIVSNAVAWTYGNYGVIVPANTITRDFHILSVSIETCSVAAGVFQLALYKGSADDVITAKRFSLAGGFWGNMVYIVGSEEVEANSQVRARLASSVGAATITVSVDYFEHQ